MPRYSIMVDIADLNVLGDCLNTISHYGKVETTFLNSQKDLKVPKPKIEYKQPKQPPYSEFVKQRNTEIIEKFKAGGNRALLAHEYNLIYQTVRLIVRGIERDGIPNHANQTPENLTRNAEIINKYESGIKTPQLAEEYNITRERVCQILRRVNAIGNAQARKEVAKQAYAEAAIKIKSDIAKELEAQINKVVELVRTGVSIRQAAMQVGIPTHTHLTNIIGKRISALGIENKHGRHRDFSSRKQAVQELADQGKSIPMIVKYLRANGDPKINPIWIYTNMPQLKHSHKT